MMTRNLLACAISAAIATAACAADNGETLETIFIKTQRGYSADATETNRDYSAFAATVTVGTKIPATPREIPQSISIITSQQIKDRNVETFDQLARKTPGLRVLSNDDGRSSIYARGYEYDEYNVNGLPAQMQSINGTPPLTASKSCAGRAVSLTAAAKWAASSTSCANAPAKTLTPPPAPVTAQKNNTNWAATSPAN